MSNYSKTTDFAAKDALTTGNANKIVKGTEIDDEFSAIQTAVNTKADVNSPTFTGTPAAPTASAATNSTQLSTTAYVTSAITTAIAAAKLALYPVGSIYTQATVATNPATLLGFGTWTAFGSGRVMVGLDGGNTLFDTLEETGGSADSPAVSSTTGSTAITIAQMPSHNHAGSAHSTSGIGDFVIQGAQGLLSRLRGYVTPSTSTSFVPAQGGGQGHTHTITNSAVTDANYQPFITVYMWKRTA